MPETEKKQSLGFIIVLIVVGIALAGGLSYFIATKTASEQVSVANTSVIYRTPGQLIKVGDPKDGLIVNIGGVNSGRYLKINIILDVMQDSGRPTENSTKGQSGGDEVKMLDAVVHVLRSLKLEQLEPPKQDELKGLLKQEINKRLGEDRIHSVYITNMVVQ